jgi:hypothetical protein
MKLPIRRLLNTNPPQFEWSQMVATMSGNGFQVIHHRGCAPVAMEDALLALLKFAEDADKNYSALQGECEALRRALLNQRTLTPEEKRKIEEDMLEKPQPVSPGGFTMQPPKQGRK